MRVLYISITPFSAARVPSCGRSDGLSRRDRPSQTKSDSPARACRVRLGPWVGVGAAQCEWHGAALGPARSRPLARSARIHSIL